MGSTHSESSCDLFVVDHASVDFLLCLLAYHPATAFFAIMVLMNKHGSASHGELSIGFLSIYQMVGTGTVGALLVLNERARPLEFHCTAPVQPSRTQRILYGATLQAYLHGEEIAVALLRRARAQIALTFTNEESVLAARHLWARPLCLLDASSSPTVALSSSAVQGATQPIPASTLDSLHAFDMGSFRCYCPSSHSEDAAVANSVWDQTTRFDLAEPFERLKEAVEEAHRCQAA